MRKVHLANDEIQTLGAIADPTRGLDVTRAMNNLAPYSQHLALGILAYLNDEFYSFSEYTSEEETFIKTLVQEGF